MFVIMRLGTSQKHFYVSARNFHPGHQIHHEKPHPSRKTVNLWISVIQTEQLCPPSSQGCHCKRTRLYISQQTYKWINGTVALFSRDGGGGGRAASAFRSDVRVRTVCRSGERGDHDFHSVYSEASETDICKNVVQSGRFGQVLHSLTSTEPRKSLGTWLREISSSSCLTFLPGPAWVLLNKIC